MTCCKQVARLPESIVEHHLFKDATSLDFSRARLVALPKRIGELVNLETLILSFSYLAAPPEGICQLTKLRVLKMYGCEFLKALPRGNPHDY